MTPELVTVKGFVPVVLVVAVVVVVVVVVVVGVVVVVYCFSQQSAFNGC